MKWFKHMTDDLDDPFVQSLIEEFGGDGYMVYFGTISLICRQQNKDNLTGKFEFSSKFLRGKFQVSAKKLSTIYQFCANFSKLSCDFSNKKFSISIPKVLDIADEWTKKLRSSSGVTPEKLPHEVEVEVEVEVEEDIKPLSCPESKKPDSARGEAKEFKFEDEDLEFSKYMFSKVSEFVPSMTKGKNKPPDVRRWASEVRLMREQDGHSISEIRDMYEWILSQPASNGGFSWKANIRSPGKLREKWETLEARRTCGTGPPVSSKLNGNRQSQKPAFRL